MSEILNPEQESSPEHQAAQLLGQTCNSLIAAADILAMHESTMSGIRGKHHGERRPSPYAPTLGATSLEVEGIMLENGDIYTLGVTHSDDVVDDEPWGVYDPSHPAANYRMTLRHLIDTPEGMADKAVFSVEMGKQVRGVMVNGEGNPSSLIVWDMDEPGDATYLRGDALLSSPEFDVMKRVETLLSHAVETEYARILLSS